VVATRFQPIVIAIPHICLGYIAVRRKRTCPVNPPNSEFGLYKLNSRCPSRDGASRSFEPGCSMSQAQLS
jgi:hypothetical protein